MKDLQQMINRTRQAYKVSAHNLPMPAFMALVRYCGNLAEHYLYCGSCQIRELCDLDMDGESS